MPPLSTSLDPSSRPSADRNADQYARAAPICGALTGLAMPKKMTTALTAAAP